MSYSLKILHIEDVSTDAELVDRTLKRAGMVFEIQVVDTKAQYTRALAEFRPDIILSDHSLPAFNSLEALKILKQTTLDIPFILITSTISEEFAVNVMKEGASDYILKDRLQRLPNAITNSVEKHQSDAERLMYLNKIVASEALFTKAELIAEFGTWSVNLAANVTNWSAGTYVLLGYQQGEVEPSHENFLRNIHPDDKDEFEKNFKNAVSDVQPADAECRIINKDGTIRYIHIQFEFELNEAGVAEYINGFNQDITRSKLAQLEIQKNIEELQAASERQSAILNALPPNIVLLNEAGKIVALNEAWKRFTIANNLGVPKYGIDCSYAAISEKATGVSEVLGKEIANGIKEVIAGSSNEYSIEYSCSLNKKNVWFQLIVAPLTDKTKKGAVVLHIDITDRKTAEEARLESEANLKTIFKNTDIAYVLCNTRHKIVSFNNKANELCMQQFNKQLKIGSNAFTFFTKDKIPDVKKAIEKVSNNEMISYETSYDQADGGVKWYEVRWVGVVNEKKINIGFILAFNDITARKISDLERDKVTVDLVKRNKDLEQFTYIVSHNLRAPVANIIGLSSMLNSHDGDFGEEAEIKSALLTSIGILDQTIMDLNHILQISTQINEKNENVSFQALVDGIMKDLNGVIQKENVTIAFDFAAADKMVTIKNYMRSIFYNLILNGIKFNRPDANPVISILSRTNGRNLEIRFKDNGKGIAEKDLKNIFGLYKRFDTTVEGKGMGLFMVKMQVENLGGRISVQSEYGSGSTFIIEFPDFKKFD